MRNGSLLVHGDVGQVASKECCSASDLITEFGAPVMSLHGRNPSGCAIVAWHGSFSSIDTVRAAMPLLRNSSSVILLDVQDGSAGTPAREAAAYLAEHGVRALIRIEHVRGRSISDIMLEEVHDRGPDFLVVARGGVIATELADCPVPLVLA